MILRLFLCYALCALATLRESLLIRLQCVPVLRALWLEIVFFSIGIEAAVLRAVLPDLFLRLE
jgi:hypothetical protein